MKLKERPMRQFARQPALSASLIGITANIGSLLRLQRPRSKMNSAASWKKQFRDKRSCSTLLIA